MATSGTYSESASSSRLNVIDWIALALMIIGGINWGLVGLFNFDLVATIFGQLSVLSRIVYVLVALAALWGLAIAMRFGRKT